MRIRHNDIEINKTDPFSNCKLGRKEYALVLTDIVKNFNDGFVLAIDNEWGTGKTTFVKMWKQYLDNNDFKTLYFNAWENDFEQDILVTLISELKELKTSKNEESFKKVINKAFPLAKSLALGLLKTQIEKHVGNEFVQEFINQTSNSVADGLQEQIEIYASKKKSIVEFKESLEKFVSQTTENKPVVFIIDELDRCRPNYAVELLEQLKHLFSVPGIVFVLSIDKIQLGNAVRGVYGSDLIDSNEYLRRFIDIEYSIPEPNIKTFTKYLYEYFGFDEFFAEEQRIQYRELQQDNSTFIKFAASLFNYERLTLRVQEKIFAHARLALTQFPANNYVVPSLFIFLIYIKFKHNTIYCNLKNERYSLQELVNQVESILPENVGEDDSHIFLYTLSMLLRSYNNSREYQNKEKLTVQDESDSKQKLTFTSQFDKSENNAKLLGFLDSSRGYYSNIHDLKLKYLIKKIDITESILLN
ncbi:KAP family P-loop NTPase fold protein [Maribellus sediminis]|uniref:KAP family P-loop NTPase fold protein n=1 Tax=Maribellus sediminis TaxID=2696285 RepID=UPI001430C733|nr:P-loop NTPase fold protein [Maribellus sediminis]